MNEKSLYFPDLKGKELKFRTVIFEKFVNDEEYYFRKNFKFEINNVGIIFSEVGMSLESFEKFVKARKKDKRLFSGNINGLKTMKYYIFFKIPITQLTTDSFIIEKIVNYIRIRKF